MKGYVEGHLHAAGAQLELRANLSPVDLVRGTRALWQLAKRQEAGVSGQGVVEVLEVEAR